MYIAHVPNLATDVLCSDKTEYKRFCPASLTQSLGNLAQIPNLNKRALSIRGLGIPNSI